MRSQRSSVAVMCNKRRRLESETGSMTSDGAAKLVAKACFLAALTMFILVAGNSEASLQFKLIRDSLIGHSTTP